MCITVRTTVGDSARVTVQFDNLTLTSTPWHVESPPFIMASIYVFLWTCPVESNPLPCGVNAQQAPFGHSVPKTVRPNQNSDVRRNPMRFYGCRFTVLNAISEHFTSMGAFNEDALPFAPGCEGSLWCGWGLFLLLGSKVSPLMPTSLFTAGLQMLVLAACRISCRYDNLIWILWLVVLQNDSYNTKINLWNLLIYHFKKAQTAL